MIGCGVLTCTGVQAATIDVFTRGDAGNSATCTLRQAIESANTNTAVGACTAGSPGPDTVSLAGLTGTITLTSGQIQVTESVTIQGPGATQTAISGNNAGRVFDVVDSGTLTTLTIDGLTILDGKVINANGGCIRAENSDNDGLVVLTHSIVTGCSATQTIADATNPYGVGGAIYSNGKGADKYYSPSVLIQNSTIIGNNATSAGGGVAGTSSVRLESSVVSGNRVDGFLADSGSIYGVGGGGVWGGVTFVDNSTISGNQVASIAEYNSSGNYSLAFGGGLFSKYSAIANSTISQNSVFGPSSSENVGQAYISGGGAMAFIVKISNSTISGNLATGRPLSGSGGPSQNIITGAGLSIFSYIPIPSGGNEIYNSTISGNQVEASGATGATDLLGTAGLSIKYTASGGTINMVSTIVSNSIGGADVGCVEYLSATPCSPALTINGDHDLVMNAENVNLPPDTLNLNPMLAPLADNGGTVAGAPGAGGTGPVQTEALYMGSPAIDQGSNSWPFDYDERGPGYPRVVGSAADIGAFEGAIPAPPVPTLGSLALALLSALLGFLGLRHSIRPSATKPTPPDSG